jgi:hypothetical protein
VIGEHLRAQHEQQVVAGEPLVDLFAEGGQEPGKQRVILGETASPASSSTISSSTPARTPSGGGPPFEPASSAAASANRGRSARNEATTPGPASRPFAP